MDSHYENASVTPMGAPAGAPATVFWSAHRRMALLLCLLLGLFLSILWLPAGTWPALFAALRLQRELVAMVFLFGVIAISLLWSAGQRLDTWLFLVLNLRGWRPAWMDRVMWVATQMGNMVAAFALAGLFFLVDMRRTAMEVILGTLTLWLLVETVKALTDRARPFLDLAEARMIGWRERGRSFPSGHTAQTFFLVTLLGHQFHPGLAETAALYGIAALVGFTRMYVGAHYPRDVLGGAVLGTVWGILAALVDPYWYGLWS